jgi:hypothetical protein
MPTFPPLLSLVYGPAAPRPITRTARRCLGDLRPFTQTALEAVVILAAQRPMTLETAGDNAKAYARQSRQWAKALHTLRSVCADYLAASGVDEDMIIASEGRPMRVARCKDGSILVEYTSTRGSTYRTAAVALIRQAARQAKSRQIRQHALSHSEEE